MVYLMSEQPSPNLIKRIFSSLGPAIITASVVLGPGSILAASQIGHDHAYQMNWVLVIAVIMMIAMTALSARLGIQLDGTICEELAKRAGRPVAAATGIILFLIVACFQYSNNLGVLAAVEPFIGTQNNADIMIIIGMNIFIMLALYGFKHLYAMIETLMKVLVGIMIIAFAINLVMAKPDWGAAIAGFIPSLPEMDTSKAKFSEMLTPIVAIYATTFSVGGAFYQSYLVRQKGWTRYNLKQGLIDSTVGICVLGLITMMVLITAAKVLYQNPDVGKLESVADVAKSLEPGFGTFGVIIFSLGIFAGAFSSFLVNAMIGGSVLSDGFDKGGYIDEKWPKLGTVAALMSGMVVAIYTNTVLEGEKPVRLIIFAQSLTVLGIPWLAITMLWLATRPDMKGENAIPFWMKFLGFLGLISSILLAGRTAFNLYLKITGG